MKLRSEIGPQLPELFIERTRSLLPDDHEAFLASFGLRRVRGLRTNSTKLSPAELLAILGLDLKPLPWCSSGFVLPPGLSLGGHPAHLAGLFYLQEPSAMSVVEALDPQSGWTIVDLTAAPGGKTTQLSAAVGNDGLIVANEVIGKRLRPLHDNLDLWGTNNVVTLSLSVSELAANAVEADELFDAAVLDVPCTGEALFRRDPTAIRHWSAASVDGVARRQRQLLAEAALLVRPGGVLVYSTCSFGLAENEQQIVDFLASTDEWVLEDCVHQLGVSAGVALPPMATELTARLWPHRGPGEGQFVARLRREDNGLSNGRDERRPSARYQRPGRRPRGSKARSGVTAEQALEAWRLFRRQTLWDVADDDHPVLVRGDRIYLGPAVRGPIDPRHLARPGLPLGQIKPGRFVPDPALAAALLESQAIQSVSWTDDDPALATYLRGDTVRHRGPDGWVLVCYHRWGLGWARRTNDVLKNHVPHHLRRQAIGYQQRTFGPGRRS